jgi:FkbM family methyltransferase
MQRQNDLIYDVGLNTGQDSEYYLRKGFRVLAIEAVASIAAGAQARLQKYVDSGQLKIVNVAIAEKPGPIKFYVHKLKNELCTSNLQYRDRFLKSGEELLEIELEAVTFPSIVEEHGIPYYMKVDIERTDMLCLEGLQQFDVRPQYVSIESSKTSWSELMREFEVFKALGFKKFKVVEQSENMFQILPKPSREGNYVNHRFEFGSSGPFGEDIAAPWLTEGETIKQYRKIFARHKLFGTQGLFHKFSWGRKFINFVRPNAGWCDTHASL